MRRFLRPALVAVVLTLSLAPDLFAGQIEEYHAPDSSAVGRDLLNRFELPVLPLFGTLKCPILITYKSDGNGVDYDFKTNLEDAISEIRHVKFWRRSWGKEGSTAYCGRGGLSDTVYELRDFMSNLKKHGAPKRGNLTIQKSWELH